MKFKQILFAAFLAAFASMAMVGCNENDPNDPDPDDGVDPVTNLEAVSLSSTSVGLRWTASTGADEYQISVRNPAGTEVTTATATGTSTTITGLTAGTIYTFGVTAVDTDIVSGDDASDETTVLWSPAQRINNDAQLGGTSILRLYPRSVSGTGKGSGIVITSTGAYNASVAGSGADIGTIQLIADVDAGGAQFTIGSPKASAFSSYTNFANFRSDVQVSDASVEIDPATGLDGWYRSASLESLFSAAGSTKSFTFADRLTDGDGVGFAVRWGTAGTYRYARVYVVPSASGELIQSDAGGDKYVEVRISYQDTPGVPYAKGN